MGNARGTGQRGPHGCRGVLYISVRSCHIEGASVRVHHIGGVSGLDVCCGWAGLSVCLKRSARARPKVRIYGTVRGTIGFAEEGSLSQCFLLFDCNVQM